MSSHERTIDLSFLVDHWRCLTRCYDFVSGIPFVFLFLIRGCHIYILKVKKKKSAYNSRQQAMSEQPFRLKGLLSWKETKTSWLLRIQISSTHRGKGGEGGEGEEGVCSIKMTGPQASRDSQGLINKQGIDNSEENGFVICTYLSRKKPFEKPQ